jgi:hypothetical protein
MASEPGIAREPEDKILAECENRAEPSGARSGSRKTEYFKAESQMLKNILARDGSLKEQAKKLGQSAKADGTLKNYTGMVSKFQCFCEKNNYDFEHFTEQAVVHFILELEKSEPSYGIFAQIKSALVLLKKARGKPISAITATADMYLEAAKRRAAKRRRPAKKAGQIPADSIERLVEGHLAKVWAGEEKPDWLKLCTILRVTVVKYTFCRFDCYNRLKAGDFEDTGDGIRETFNSAKNDQLHQGNCSFIGQGGQVRVPAVQLQDRGQRGRQIRELCAEEDEGGMSGGREQETELFDSNGKAERIDEGDRDGRYRGDGQVL